MDLLLSPHEFRRLEGLRLQARKTFSGRIRGERLTRKKGISTEFADYREYAEGDDLRHLDWNVLARLDTPVMRTYQDEEDLAVHVLLDASPSMTFGEPSKLEVAQRLAAALTYVTLTGGDAVVPRILGRREPPHRLLRGRVGFPVFARWAKAPMEGSPEPLARSLRGFAGTAVRTGVALIVSDGLDPDFPAALRAVAAKGHEILLLLVLSDIELDPDLEGDLRLVDAEGGNPVELTANGAALREYRRRLDEHLGAIGSAVQRYGGRHALVRTSDPFEGVVDRVLRRGGWVTSGGGK
jgi:uncharacterized protein (DUF58 family)